ncbi:hypothetical protein E1B28_002874 [Marasmius oreades]|uniref:DUF7223 domain-containing protein n=1 Tax=Marasmius oreades TaxID=181124 RepID=A0A9P7ULD3_9AGAR|nr:uncharacterized protein E1B28_002874 [Marasmius oreades]KAG7086957.1 hypothetical protein E1B28_002874 [Marasmius oreades]
MVNGLSLPSLALLPLVFLSAFAENDWKTPCLNGVCQYSFTGSSSGTVKIWGSPDAITDITTAAGWEILGCSSDALAQDIRLVCQGDENSEESGCAHLYQNIGAEGKIVRLPENCGKSAFARVSKAWVSEDQSIPATVAKRLVRRDGAPPVVKALRLDTDFAAADTWKKVGPVNIAIQGANFDGADVKGVMQTAGPQRRSRLFGRDTNNLFGIGKVDFNKTVDLPPFSLTKNANLLDAKVSCPKFDAGIKVDIDSDGSAQVSIGAVATGTIIPPKVEKFQLFSGLDANVNGTLSMKADASGILDSGRIKVFEVGVPGLDIPGIFSIGPTFTINAQAVATLDLNVDMTVGFVYNVNKATLFFPDKDNKESGGDFEIGDTPLTLSTDANAQINGNVQAHLIPGINLGISALSIANAEVFLELDASATLSLNAAASTKKSQGTNATTTGGGCVDMGVGLDVAAGARGNFFSIFNEQTQVSLFNKQFELFNKCFGDQGNSTETAKGETSADDKTTTEDDTTADDDTTTEDDTTAGDDTTADDDTTAENNTTTDDDTAAGETTAEDEATTGGQKTKAEAKVAAPARRRSRIMGRQAKIEKASVKAAKTKTDSPKEKQGNATSQALQCLKSIAKATLLTSGTISKSEIKTV